MCLNTCVTLVLFTWCTTTRNYTSRGRIARRARAVHKVCTEPYPNCIVVPSINNNEPRVRSPSPPPSPSQRRRSLLALLEAKQRNPQPPRWSNTPSTSVSQPRAASWPARSPSASTANGLSRPVQRTSHLRSAPGLGHSRSQGRSPSCSTSKPRPKRGRAPKTTAHSCENEKGRNTTVRPICLYGIGRSFETFGWVPPMTKGWGET